MRRTNQLDAQSGCHRRRQRVGGTAERDQRGIRSEIVAAARLSRRIGDLLDRPLEQGRGRLLRPHPQTASEHGEGCQHRLTARVGMLGNQTEGICRASGGQRKTPLSGRDADIILRVPGTRSDRFQTELPLQQLVGRGETDIRQPADVSAAGPDLGDAAATQARHAAPGGADHPAVDRPDRGRSAHHPDRAQDGPPLLHHGDIRAGAATLENDRVGDPELMQGRRDTGGRPGADREGRPAAEGLDAHRTAVATQNEQRCADARRLESGLDDTRGRFDDRQHGGVDRGADRARLEPIGARELVPAAGRHAQLAGRGGNRQLLFGIVHGVGPADRDRLTTARGETLERGTHVGSGEATACVEQLMLAVELMPGRQSDRADPGAPRRRS